MLLNMTEMIHNSKDTYVSKTFWLCLLVFACGEKQKNVMKIYRYEEKHTLSNSNGIIEWK